MKRSLRLNSYFTTTRFCAYTLNISSPTVPWIQQQMAEHTIIYSIFLIFFGAALLATFALYARQSMLLAYILVGGIAGPWGLGLVTDTAFIEQIAQVGIIFLLFLLGMSLEPRELLRMMREATVVTVGSSIIFAIIGLGLGFLFGFNTVDSIIIGIAMMFSSTIIGLKLLPTTTLHHQHMGEVIISVLLLQDIIAILALLFMHAYGTDNDPLAATAILAVKLPALVLFAFLFSRYVLQTLITRFDQIQEYVFLVTIGWCLGIAELAAYIGLSHEIGAFIGGVSLAISPISRFITESLKPIRDFFLIMFFFSLGARFNMDLLSTLFIPAISIAVTMLLIKPLVFSYIMKMEGEKSGIANQTGFRLGQISEFSLLIAIVALNVSLISERASFLIQTATLITFIASSYFIVMRYPTPIAVNDKLRKN